MISSCGGWCWINAEKNGNHRSSQFLPSRLIRAQPAVISTKAGCQNDRIAASGLTAINDRRLIADCGRKKTLDEWELATGSYFDHPRLCAQSSEHSPLRWLRLFPLSLFPIQRLP